MSDYERLAGLELEIDGYTTERRSLRITSEMTRVTTTVVLHGGILAGRGEDVTYEADQHDLFPTDLSLDGRMTLDEFSQRLRQHDLPDYRRWAFESAGLDLALRRAGTSLGDVVGRTYRPVRFVVSTRGDIRDWLAFDPTLEFKVDTAGDWTRVRMDELAETGRVRCVDIKGYYVGEWVDRLEPDAYEDILAAFPEAVIEDAMFTDGTRELLHANARRLSFDAPIHSVADVEALEVRPGCLNIKPSRFGTCARLFEALAYCERNAISMYGGGQFELGVGREQIQALASLYYSDAPNDVAPGVYNEPPPRPGLPGSPLEPPAKPRGLGFSG